MPALALSYEEFLALVGQAAGIDREQAERATRVVLQTLAERIDAGEARDLAVELPEELAPWMATNNGAERYDVGEFLRRVAEREGVDWATAERYAKAVFVALGRAVSAKELSDVTAELPRDFAPLLPQGPAIDVISAGLFLRRVAERGGLDEAQARAATEAVLETLATRIAGGEVDDLLARLPVGLHSPLERGKELSGGKAIRMRLDDFLERAAELEGTSTDTALDHVRAVLATLREAVDESEFLDVTAQLPDEYTAILAH